MIKSCQNLVSKYDKFIKQIFRFIIIGGIAFFIDYGVFSLLNQVLNIHYLISNIMSFSISVIFNYIMSITWVFDITKKQTKKDFAIFIILSIIGLIFNSIIIYISVDILNIYELISKIIATCTVMIYNFITRKIFIEK